MGTAKFLLFLYAIFSKLLFMKLNINSCKFSDAEDCAAQQCGLILERGIKYRASSADPLRQQIRKRTAGFRKRCRNAAVENNCLRICETLNIVDTDRCIL